MVLVDRILDRAVPDGGAADLTRRPIAFDDQEIAQRWVVAMRGKRAGHGIDDPTFLQPDRPMSAIGG